MTHPSGIRIKLTPDRAAAALVALAPLVYFFPAVRGALVLAPADGVIQNVPLRVAAARITLDGSLPLWNPYIFCGMPLHGAAQAGLLFPLNWFYLAFSAPLATNLMMLSTYSLAALGAFLYARRSGADITGAIVTSIVWQWSAFMVCQIGHTNIVQTAACLPWLLWAVDGYGATGRRWRGVLLSALVALQVFTGHPQTFVYSLLLVSAYALVMARASKETHRDYLRSLLFVAGGVLLAAVQILPTFELMRNSLRGSASYDFFTSFSLPRRFVLTLFAPFLSGGGDGRLFRAPYVGPQFFAEYAAYVGVVALMLAVLAVVLRRDARTKFWAVVVVVCLILALGGYAPFGLYRLIYYVPVLNLFRVPARHLMEVDFALAVLAGRGLTAIAELRSQSKTLRRVLVIGASVVLLTCLAVTLGRPADFQLGRQAPVSLLRAPELFLPIVFAVLGAWALWIFARKRRGAVALLLTVLAIDLIVWGQSSGWYTSSPRTDEEVWRVPETVRFLREVAPRAPGSYRILTAPHTFDPAVPPVPPSVSHSTDWTLWTQPDVYMMYGIQNAAGYDGFGLERYSHLAGEMKVWGELTDPDATLRGDSRAMDLLNVRYLLSVRKQSTEATSPVAIEFPPATENHGGFMFSQNDLGLPNLGASKQMRFTVTPIEVDHVALLTNLSWSENVPDGATIGRLRLRAKDGRAFEFPLRAGVDTAEWSYDRPDIRARIRHKRPAVATSYEVKDAQGNYEGHTYVTSIALPQKAFIESGEISLERGTQWPNLLLSVFRVSLVNASENKTYPLRREWVRVENISTPGESQEGAQPKSDRWKLLTETSTDIYENARALPRAWLASDVRVLEERAMLETIRSGTLSDGTKWDPLRTALVAAVPANALPAATPNGRAEITRYEPNRVDVKTDSTGASILVLSENHYPGWRAYIDARGVDVMRVDYNLRGVLLLAGHHEVSFIYRPKSVLIGFVISLISLVLLVVWGARGVPEKFSRRLTSLFHRQTVLQDDRP